MYCIYFCYVCLNHETTPKQISFGVVSWFIKQKDPLKCFLLKLEKGKGPCLLSKLCQETVRISEGTLVLLGPDFEPLTCTHLKTHLVGSMAKSIRH